MALISSSVKPLAMRPMTVEGKLPRLEALHGGDDVARDCGRPAAARGVHRAAGGMAARAGQRHPGGASAAPAAKLWRDPQPRAAPRRDMRVLVMSDLRRMAAAHRPLGLRVSQIMVLQRQRADALAGCREDRITQRRRDDRNRGLADPAPGRRRWARSRSRSSASGQPQHRIVVEIRLLDAAVLDGDLAVEGGGEREDGRAFDLHLDRQRVDHGGRSRWR